MIIGLDYSLSCPAMAIGFQPGWEDVQIYYQTTIKKYEGSWFLGQVNGSLQSEYKTEEQRYDALSAYFIRVLDGLKVPANTLVYIEDYSFGSTGRVFHLGENTGLIKHKLYRRGHTIIPLAPSTIKKHATGSGAAKKPQMYEAFRQVGGPDLLTAMGAKKPDGSPISDIVDAFSIAQMGFTLTKTKSIIEASTVH